MRAKKLKDKYGRDSLHELYRQSECHHEGDIFWQF
jgi:hypothetical protein